MTCPHKRKIEVIRMFFPEAVDKIDQHKRVINHYSREGKKPDERDKGQGIMAHEKSNHDSERNKRDCDHNYDRLAK